MPVSDEYTSTPVFVTQRPSQSITTNAMDAKSFMRPSFLAHAQTYKSPPPAEAVGDPDIDEIGLTAREAFTQHGRDVLRIGHAARGEAEGLGERHEIDVGVAQVHAGEAVGLAERHQALLDDAVAAVVRHDVGDRQRLVRGGPQSLDAVHRAAVADHHRDRPAWERHADADGAGNGEAE